MYSSFVNISKYDLAHWNAAKEKIYATQNFLGQKNTFYYCWMLVGKKSSINYKDLKGVP